ncbi:TIGR03013 family XrtA/PEP-CTERM system glycosyltransferase [Alteromonas sp. 14N.309.X.WAT.G.H12]|uniref:TIGR03013 family XrtA/PEP-CTERM system glycosyltransferase n=1 Tax=Alteromonas sp. 14N.309.X.WAT.G.H12 TaxID=3120824 RepID=UPI002FD3868D
MINTYKLKRAFFFFFFDALSFMFAFLAAWTFAVLLGKHQQVFQELLVSAVVIVPVMTSLHLSLGLYETKLRETAWAAFTRGIMSMMGIYMAFQGVLIALKINIHPFTLCAILFVALSLQILWRYWAIDCGLFYITRRKVLILGGGERAAFLPRRMRRSTDRKHFTLVGFLPVSNLSDSVKYAERIVTLDENSTVAQKLRFLQEKGAVDTLVIATDKNEDIPGDALLDLKMDGVNVVELEDFVEAELGQLAVENMRPEWLLRSGGFKFNSILSMKCYDALNGLLALVLLFLFFPIMLLVIVAIYLDDGHRNKTSFLYKQVRVGRGGRHFNILKFRSMGKDSEKDGVQWAQSNDARITRIGGILRKYRLDELPQLFNVLKGDMYFVGPRPERPYFVEQLEQAIPFYSYRHSVKPGLTGWAQINYPYGSSTRDSLEKLKFDLYYIKHHSFILDLYVLVRTVDVVLFGKGR